MTAITRTGLAGGLWQGLARGGENAPDLRLRHADDIVLTPEVEAHPGGGWAISFRLPIDRVADGVQTFVIEDAASGEALLSETLIAGPETGHDLRAEVDLLRAELDMLKRAFRRHCTAD